MAWNPTVKLGTLLVASGAVLLVTDPVTPVVLWLLATGAALLLGRVPAGTLLRAQLALVAFAGSVFSSNLLLRHDGDVLAVVGPVEVTSGALAVATSFAARTLYLGTVSVLLVVTTDPARLMVSLHQHARVPATTSYAVLAAHRVLELLPAEWEAIRSAQAVRDPRRAAGAPLPRSPRALGTAVFALLVAAVRRAERTAIALESRGLGSGPRTTAHKVPLRAGDVVAAAAVLGVVAGVLLAGWWGGWLSGPAALTA
ncbi:energy-coupling factor transporter transmembrane component T [Isoptericola luteus]|uniref:energy-coupling factor transporter transmembrane component T family protein n=1 Tax=Isoptericola luteus TaxID=2879484 RepID=UPI0027E1D99A|nr:energy-coupling factor transporter transmembrane component T [Isoptericola sp. NEAU-Y5]